MAHLLSFGRHISHDPKEIIAPYWADEPLSLTPPCLPYGNGRSYGDVCLNHQGTIIHTKHLNRFLHFDAKTGIISAESGVTIKEILNCVTPFGWTLPVVPGTQWVTLGGAIANDIHGKNHRQAGTFGCHIREFHLRRSDQATYVCSPTQNQELFHATLGGLGLTGLITQAEVKLKPIPSPFLKIEKIPFHTLDEFFDIDEASHQSEYTVAWLDSKRESGRGIYMRGDFCESNQVAPKIISRSIPFDFPSFVLNRASITLFNQFYLSQGLKPPLTKVMHYIPYFFPLDSLSHWNRMYGKRGFLQYQCVIENEFAKKGIADLLKVIARSKLGSFLSVLKSFGEIKSPGLLSFPKPGITLALDFPNTSKARQLFQTLDNIVINAGGRVYPAKDALMHAQTFQQYYPHWKTFKTYIDPAFSSDFWRRVMRGLS